MSSVLLMGLIGVAGVVIGLIAGRFVDPVRKQQWQQGNNLKQTEKELDTLKSQVNDHFSQTAQTLSDLQAQVVTDAAHITGLNLEISVDDTANLNHLLGENTIPPRDYAPKMEDSVGTLSEEYGLKEDGDYQTKPA